MNSQRIIKNTVPYDSETTKGKIIHKLNNIIKILNKEENDNEFRFSWIDPAVLDNVELSVLRLYLEICRAHEETYSDKGEDSGLNDLYDHYPINIYWNNEYKTLLIDAPISLASYRTPKGKEQEHLLANTISIGLKNYLASHETPVMYLDREYDIMVIRRTGRNLSSNAVPDIDNIEIRNLVNTLVKDLGFTSDSYSHLVGMTSTIEYVEDRADYGTSFIVINDAYKLELVRVFLKNGRSFNFLRQNNKTV